MKRRYFAYRSFYPEIETMREFRAVGVDTFAVMLSNGLNALGTPYTKYPPVWTGKKQYDLAAADAPFEDILKKIPDAKFIGFIDLNTPLWWTRYLGAYGARCDSYYELGRIAASKLWREDTLDYMKTLLTHLDSKFRGRILSYAFGCGGGTEWHDRSRGTESLYRLDAFRKWCLLHRKEWREIPSMGRREKGMREFGFTAPFDRSGYWCGYDDSEIDPLIRQEAGGLFYDPSEQADVVDYWHCCNELIADTIDFFLKEARRCVRPEVELGAVYGYVTTEGQYMLSSNGHLEYEKLLASDSLDYLLAPATDRDIGGGSGSLCAVGTVHAYGKQMLNSADNETYSSKAPDGAEFPPAWIRMHTEEEVAASLKREIAVNLVEQTSLWFFDKWGGSYSRKAVELIGKGKGIWDRETRISARPAAQMLMVVDPRNLYYINNFHVNSNNFHLPWKLNLNRSGAPFEIVSFNDFSRLDMERFKLVIFCHPFELTGEAMEILEKQVLNAGRTVIWSYGPGIVHNGRWDESNVEKFCGMPFGSEEVKILHRGNWNSIYVHDPGRVTPEILRGFAREAGVWIYASKPRPVFANERLLAVHTGCAENLTLSLPRRYSRVVELFTGEEFRDTDRLVFDTVGPDTKLFSLQGQENAK
ncbi:MAG: hypothetical protein BWY31_02276 [Lentisphaerae bacterium ADurb.Bin242]|nr:MAG: hypothetical protein BWY31_02276 [Lentisphaerae bacterium ADurb.Bin242]